MGNVSAHGLNVEDDDDDDEGVPSPGLMEDLHKKTKDVFPLNFDGIKLVVNKGLSNHFQISHTVTMSTTTPSGYRFGSTYVGTNIVGPNEAYPILAGDIDPTGNMNANIITKLSDSIRFKLSCQLAKTGAMTQVQSDYTSSRSSASLTFANMDVKTESGLIVAHYLKNVSRRLALGGEFAFQFGPRVPGNEIALLSLAARYSGRSSTLSTTIGAHALQICFYQRASEQLQLGCELETNFRLGESVASLGYQIEIPRTDLTYRGMIDSNWNIGGVVEKKLAPLPFIFTLSGMINHYKNYYKLGCGVIIGG